jgi:serine/threonine-protein phosphatase 2A regulatory subunit A
MALASSFRSLIKFAGGPEYAHVLLGPLKVLASSEEFLVREKAIETMGVICDSISTSNDSNLMSTCKDLAQAEFFSARCSACAFLVKIYAKVSDQSKSVLRQLFKALVKDETPMVRRTALRYLPALCEALPSPIIIADVAKDILSQALQDDEDSVRLLLPPSLAVMSAKLVDAERAVIVSAMKSIVKDGSWRVRSALAGELPAIAKPFEVDGVMNDICPILLRLLRDTESETKTTACRAISGD